MTIEGVDGYWWSNDGVRLHYRDYPGDAPRTPVLCLPGLTRNARDFAPLAAAVEGRRRVVAVSFRGRGDSGLSPDALAYVPLTYLQDVAALYAHLGWDGAIVVGTSLGGLVAMLVAAARPAMVAGVVLNDVGPVLEADGLARIRSYVGKAGSWPTWVHAARALAELHGAAHPDYALTDWIAMAKRLCRLGPGGRIVADYDPRIAEPLRMPGGDATIDLWPAFDALADAPMLIVRGDRSDVLSAATLDEMAARHPDARTLTVARTGHAPTLVEPEAVTAVTAFLDSIA